MSYADRIFYNGSVITFDPEDRIESAVAVKDGRILFVGQADEALKLAGPDTRLDDLQGRTLLPGFYEAHGHFPSSGLLEARVVPLWSKPRGTVGSIGELLSVLSASAQAKADGEWILGFGYDPSKLAEQRHPTRQELDRVSTAHPIWITHNSGHMGVANSRALEIAGIDSQTPEPETGIIERDAQGEPTGLIQENAALIERWIPEGSEQEKLEAIRLANNSYIARGITTAVIALQSDNELLFQAADSGTLKLSLVSVPLYRPGTSPAEAEFVRGSFRSQGAKLFQDGSIQGYTGWLSQPYHRPADEADPLFSGFPTQSREALAQAVREVHRAGVQLVVHANGDAAIDDVLDAIEAAQEEFPRSDARHRIEHAQTVREDQLDRIRRLGVTPSFFNDHVYYFGDQHRDVYLGEERASRISPLKSALDRGIRFSLHNDTPVTPADPLHLVWVAVNRITASGQLLGPEFRISPYEALRAVTVDAAWQAFDEQEKGSIEPGKRADFVILSDNPLEVAPVDIKDIGIVETIINGASVYAGA